MISASEPTATFDARLFANGNRDVQQRTATRMLSGRTAAVIARLRKIAPYAALELILPGGSLMAILLWLYHRQKKSSLLPIARPAGQLTDDLAGSLYAIGGHRAQ
jgi:hypothetical protein